MNVSSDVLLRMGWRIEKAMAEPQSRWYKNCRSVRKRGGKICLTCPFRPLIETYESVRGEVKS